jgi:hypothetical protein
MSKRALSITLGEENLLWLKGRAAHSRGTVSSLLDRFVSEARAGRLGTPPASRSVVGTIDLAIDDPDLSGADRAIRTLFDRSLARPTIARESSPSYGGRRRTRKPARG